MPERKHNLTSRYERLDDQITGNVVNSVVIHPRSHGRLYLPGEWSTDSRPPAHEVKRSSSDPDNGSIYTKRNELGGPEHYVVNYDVWNHRDSPSFARIVLTSHEEREDTPGG